jgi:sulfate permease, SulP family
MSAQKRQARRSNQVLPLLSSFAKYKGEWFRGDLLAGLAVAGLVIPKALGYAGIASVPIEYGLYAAAAGTILYGLLGTSRQISTGPSSALASVAGAAVLTAAATGPDAIKMAAAVTFFSGMLLLLMAVFRMGWVSQFLSRAVITGFLFGAGVSTAIGELGKITGTDVSGTNAWQELGSWIRSFSEAQPATVVVGVASLVLVFGIRYIAPKWPESLILLVTGLVASASLDLGAYGIALVGNVPSGLPAVVLPDLAYAANHLGIVLVASVALVLIGFSQTAGDARAFAAEHRYRVNIDQESVAQGVANVGSGLLQGIPVSTSLSGSSLNDNAGAKTQLATLITGAVVILTMLFLAPVFSNLPKPVLAALIIEAVIMGMVNVPEMRRLYRVKRQDFWIAVAAIVGVLASGVLAGVVIGIVLSVFWLVYTAARPDMPVLGREAGTQAFRSLEEFPEGRRYPGVVALGFESDLFFINSDALEDRLMRVIEQEGALDTIVLSFEGVTFIDSQGTGKVRDLISLTRNNGVELRLARVKEQVADVLRRDQVLEELGEDAIYSNIYEAMKDHIPADDR